MGQTNIPLRAGARDYARSMKRGGSRLTQNSSDTDWLLQDLK